MPTYEYRCRACDHTFEIVQRMSDDTLTICPECGGELRKVFAPPVITFKGSGFYATDHGKKSKAGGEKTGEKPAASAESSDGTGAKKDAKEPSKSKEPAVAKGSDASSSSTGSGSSSSTTSGSDGKKKGA